MQYQAQISMHRLEWLGESLTGGRACFSSHS
jgi:hypothetical protein